MLQEKIIEGLIPHIRWLTIIIHNTADLSLISINENVNLLQTLKMVV